MYPPLVGEWPPLPVGGVGIECAEVAPAAAPAPAAPAPKPEKPVAAHAVVLRVAGASVRGAAAMAQAALKVRERGGDYTAIFVFGVNRCPNPCVPTLNPIP